MSVQPATRDAERFRTVLGQRIGLLFDDAKLGYLGTVLQRRIEKRGRDSAAYLWELEHEPSHGEISALARELTVGETYFFRNHEQFRALAEVVLPERLRRSSGQKTLRLLSAGCSSGEEAYSMAIVAREGIPDPTWNSAIRAVDINPSALQKARQAHYSAWALRETPEDIRSRWFRAEGRQFALDDAIRRMVAVEAANLATDDLDLWRPATYDVIFCRNVLMYFEPMRMRGVIARFARALVPGGFLFLGHAETLRGVSDEFQLCNSHGTFYYCLSDAPRPSPVPSREFPPKESCEFAPKASSVRISPRLCKQDATWFDDIRLASERVATLLPMGEFCRLTGRRQVIAPQFDPALTMALLREERFAEALDHLREQSRGHDRDAEVLLLETTLLVHSGQVVPAERSALRLLSIDQDNAGAHYLLALCRDHAGDSDGACDHHRAATMLDPAFAMPRVHLGLLARRDGDHNAACREFARARALLKDEAPSRVLLFGGGFSRESLMALCDSALMDRRGQP